MVLPADEPNEEEQREQLPEDYATPFSPSSDTNDGQTGSSSSSTQTGGVIDTTHPATDTDLDEDDWYNSGLAAAAGASEPNASNTVTEYDKNANTSRSTDE